jgi:hypothetical protein
MGTLAGCGQKMKEEELCELILENVHVLTCFNCGKTLESTMCLAKWSDEVAVLNIDPGESNYPHEPDISASAFFECMECNRYGTGSEIVTLKNRVKELEDACVHYAAREAQLIDMLQRIAEITEDEDQYDAM